MAQYKFKLPALLLWFGILKMKIIGPVTKLFGIRFSILEHEAGMVKMLAEKHGKAVKFVLAPFTVLDNGGISKAEIGLIKEIFETISDVEELIFQANSESRMF
jgi:hypothetical protein